MSSALNWHNSINVVSRCFVYVETTSINIRRLNFHFQPNINVETTLMNVDDQRCFDVDTMLMCLLFWTFYSKRYKANESLLGFIAKNNYDDSCTTHCVKRVQIKSFFRSVFSCIQSDYRKMRNRKNSVSGHFPRSDRLRKLQPLKRSLVLAFLQMNPS